MKAYLIDPLARTVTEMDFNENELLASISQHLDCDLVDSVRISRTDAIFVDDTGMVREGAEERGFFSVRGYPQILNGRGLVLGNDEGGECVAPSIKLEALQAMIGFSHA